MSRAALVSGSTPRGVCRWGQVCVQEDHKWVWVHPNTPLSHAPERRKKAPYVGWFNVSWGLDLKKHEHKCKFFKRLEFGVLADLKQNRAKVKCLKSCAVCVGRDHWPCPPWSAPQNTKYFYQTSEGFTYHDRLLLEFILPGWTWNTVSESYVNEGRFFPRTLQGLLKALLSDLMRRAAFSYFPSPFIIYYAIFSSYSSIPYKWLISQASLLITR